MEGRNTRAAMNRTETGCWCDHDGDADVKNYENLFDECVWGVGGVCACACVF